MARTIAALRLPVNDALLRAAGMRRLRVAAALLLVFAAVGLRLVALGSDPYPRLDWSAGLLTDEGFYIHNARNVALFGLARTNEFNNMLLSPMLHFAQVAVFRVAGAGSVQARAISVVCSLFAMALMWSALRRVWNPIVAWSAVAIMALDHTNLLYSRMALMDPPAAFGAALAFWLFVRSPGPVMSLACGLVLGATVLNRSLCVFLVPAPFVALVLAREPARRASAVLAGMALAVLLWLSLWWAPNRAEIGRTSRYYRVHQLQPASVAKLTSNLYHGALGDHRGISAYLFRHTPVVLFLAVTFIAAGLIRSRGMPVLAGDPHRAAAAYLVTWLGSAVLLLSAVSYSPSRYYIAMYPALAAVAAVAFWSWPEVARRLVEYGRLPSAIRALGVWYFAYHAAQTLVHRGGVVSPAVTVAVLYGAPTLFATLAAGWRFSNLWRPALWWPALPVLWCLGNLYWLGDWARTLRHTQRDFSIELAHSLPKGAVLIGDVAPGISLDNGFAVVNVIPGLCNGDRPIERERGRPRYVAILDGRWKERYWLEHYPQLVDAARRVALRRVMRWDIGIYAVDQPPQPISVSSNRMRKGDDA